MTTIEGDETAQTLVELLKELRRDYGLFEVSPFPSADAAVLAALHIDAGLARSEIGLALSQKLVVAVGSLRETLPKEHAVLRVTFNLGNEKRRWLKRAEEYALSSRISVRTVVRLSNAAIILLAATMIERDKVETKQFPEVPPVALAKLKEILDQKRELRIRKFEVSVRVFHEYVDVHESVDVVSMSEAAHFYVVGKTLPYSSSEVTTTVWEGAELLDVEQPNPHWLLELLELPEPLPKGQSHHFALTHRTRHMAPMWTATSMHEADELTVRVWYADKLARQVWLINEFPPKLLNTDDIGPVLHSHATKIPVDRLGSASWTFRNLTRDRSYGLAWTSPVNHNSNDE